MGYRGFPWGRPPGRGVLLLMPLRRLSASSVTRFELVIRNLGMMGLQQWTGLAFGESRSIQKQRRIRKPLGIGRGRHRLACYASGVFFVMLACLRSVLQPCLAQETIVTSIFRSESKKK